ncbi:TetR/AcrR family transcriptional regulator [Streptomyces lydicus]|uniref:TetR/AcrR family transcriptional regulator n=1 Tax=Streptomyces lydicus TaxID=47763 RepID=UPI0036FCDCD1
MKGKSTERAGYHHGDLPAALTAAAIELLDERGTEHVIVREVARRAGVSPGAPFRHFAGRTRSPTTADPATSTPALPS